MRAVEIDSGASGPIEVYTDTVGDPYACKEGNKRNIQCHYHDQIVLRKLRCSSDRPYALCDS